MAKKDLTGKIYGRLTVIKDTGMRKNECVIWECQCECGEIVEVSSANLVHGRTRSCGCLHLEAIKQPKMKKIPVRIPKIKDLDDVNDFRELRMKTGASQNWFAEYFGISSRFLANCEQNGMSVRGGARSVLEMMKRILAAEAGLRDAWKFAAGLRKEPEYDGVSDSVCESVGGVDVLKKAESVLDLRIATGWSSTHFAKSFGMTLATLTAWEGGRSGKIAGTFELMKRTLVTEAALVEAWDFVSALKSSDVAVGAEFKDKVKKNANDKISELDVFEYTKSAYAEIWNEINDPGEEISGKDLTNYLRDRRQDLGLSQGDVARALCVDPASVSRWESGKHGVHGKYLFEYAKLLETTPAVIKLATASK